MTRSDLHILAVLAGLAAVQVAAFRTALRFPRVLLAGAALAGSCSVEPPPADMTALQVRAPRRGLRGSAAPSGRRRRARV